ncbi:hypothetical protein NQ038_09565 [Brevibacterium sp. 50QC2O2]|uniref:hypothetical protein n=1 Tax=Brevibacterium TaxID=1696 RepID=UPI00211C8E30|nr:MULTISPECIES: hypothetical protein [unclassified Brevibacterium]MCQ9366754.1 hypothetical protein [Brevibacterium sp. 91QC2O2]MCQ9384274.1 hypothetical protein [Brevibacterium sp. 68QC2CO]MCQ9388893.1 hypothetical protein [Brevibacterium sp. 50QC2O2]
MNTTQVPENVGVHAGDDHIEVTGLSEDEVRQAIALFQATGREQLRARSALYAHVNRAMVDAAIPLIPEATARQAQRLAANREALLLEHDHETYRSLAQKRQSRESSARTWVARMRERGDLFTLKVAGQTIIPALQLTADGTLEASMTPLVRTLLAAGMNGWSLWAWLTSPSGLLSGGIPAEVVGDNPRRALRAATRMAAELELTQRPVSAEVA